MLAAPGALRQVAERLGVSHASVCRVRARREKLCQGSLGVQCNHRSLRLAVARPSDVVVMDHLSARKVASGDRIASGVQCNSCNAAMRGTGQREPAVCV